MGLEVSHDCWYGAYSAFNRFRNLLWEVAGYKLKEWPGDYGLSHVNADLPEDVWTEDHLWGAWTDQAPEDPLVVLMVHYDTDGVIENRWCLPLAKRLEQLAPKLPTEGTGHLHNPQEQALQFAQGLRAAAEAGEGVGFG